MKSHRYQTWFFALLLMALASPAFANMMMVPVGFIIGFMKWSHWSIIPLIMAVEAVAIWLIFSFNLKRALLASVSVNVATAFLGFVVYFAAYETLEPLLSPIIIALTGGGSLVEYVAIAVGVSLIDTGIELLLLIKVFGAVRSWRKAVAYLLVNMLTAFTLMMGVPLLIQAEDIQHETPRLSPEEQAARWEAEAARWEALVRPERVKKELEFFKYAREALSRGDSEAAYRLIEDGIISEYEEVQKETRKFVEQHPELYGSARHTFTPESLRESIRIYGEEARELEERRLSIYKIVAPAEDYATAQYNYDSVFGDAD